MAKTNSNNIYNVSGPNPAEAAASAGNSAVINPGAESNSPSGFTYDNTMPEEVQVAFAEPGVVNDDMSFADAFAAARRSLGAGGAFTWHGKVYGTYYEDEWNALTPQEQNQFSQSVFGDSDLDAVIDEFYEPDSADDLASDIPVFTGVTDDMSFADAFAAARSAVGAGGTFTWHGQVYGTYYQNEWNDMPQDARQQWVSAATGHGSVSDGLPSFDPANEMADVSGVEELELDSEVLEMSDDDSEISIVGIESMEYDGNTINLATLDVNGEPVVMVDLDNDSIYDYAIGDFDGSGDVLDSTDDIVDISSSGLTVGDVASAMEMQDNSFDVMPDDTAEMDYPTDIEMV